MIASYNISIWLSQSKKSRIIGEELILLPVKEIIEIVFYHLALYNVIKKVPLSNDILRRRIDEMAESEEVSLCELLVYTKIFL